MHPKVKSALEFLPLLIFFIFYKGWGLFAATSAIMVTTVIILAVTYYYERRIALNPLITAIVIGIFGGLTLYLHDERFIKVKPTLINLVFAGILLGGCAMGKGLLQPLFKQAFTLSERGWWLLSRRFGLFFIALALLNEWVWRTFPTDVWVNFKVFGIMGLTVLFMLFQIRLIEKHKIE